MTIFKRLGPPAATQFFDELRQDLRHGFRLMARNARFALVIVLILGFGIGASSTIFSFVSGLVLRPLAIEDVGALAQLYEHRPANPAERSPVAYPNFLDWQTQNDVFEDLAAFRFENPAFASGGEARQIPSMRASATIFHLLRAQIAIGRPFTPEDDRLGAPLVVVLTNRFWRDEFGADPNVIGRTIRLDGYIGAVIGVLRDDPEYFGAARVWLPLALSRDASARSSHFLSAVGRLKEGVSLERAQTNLDTIAARLTDNRLDGAQLGVSVVRFQDAVLDFIYPALAVAMASAAFLLLISCVNVANLVLARGATRTREIAIRASLGATRSRIVRQLLTESMLLSALGGGLGLLICHWSIGPLSAISPEIYQRLNADIGIDSSVLGLATAIAILTSLLSGLGPALRITRPARFSRRHRVRNLLVVSEIALTLMLLLGAGLLLKSYARVYSVSPGLRTENALTMQISIPRSKYPADADVLRFYTRALEEIRGLPGVEAAATVQMLPFGGRNQFAPFDVEGAPPNLFGESYGLANTQVISANYFHAAGVNLRTGRSFTEQDGQGTPRVAIINEALARRVWRGEDPTGRQIRVGPPEWGQPWLTIVGVAGNVMHYGLDQAAPLDIYVPFDQVPIRDTALIVHTGSDPLDPAGAIRRRISEIDPDQPVSEVRSMKQVIDESLWQRRALLVVMLLFSGVALVLSSTGLYSVIAYSVHQRRSEFGIRMALGAQQQDILKLAIGEGLRLVLAGIALGLAGGLVGVRGISSLIYGITATDLPTFAGIVALLFAIALIAAYVPARNALKADPVSVLKVE